MAKIHVETTINGEPVESDVVKGFATIRRVWKKGDTVELDIPMPVRYSTTIDQVEAMYDILISIFEALKSAIAVGENSTSTVSEAPPAMEAGIADAIV